MFLAKCHNYIKQDLAADAGVQSGCQWHHPSTCSYLGDLLLTSLTIFVATYQCQEAIFSSSCILEGYDTLMPYARLKRVQVS